MITAEEALERANNYHEIAEWKTKISDEIIKACDDGMKHVSIGMNKRFNTSVEEILIEWLKSFGYRGFVREYQDAGSGWTFPLLEIWWKEADDNGND